MSFSQTALACAVGAAASVYDVLTTCNGISGVHWYMDGAKRHRDKRAADHAVMAAFLHRYRDVKPEAVYIHFRREHGANGSGGKLLPLWADLSLEARKAYAVFAATYLAMVAEDERQDARQAERAAGTEHEPAGAAGTAGIGEVIGRREPVSRRGDILERIS